MPVSTDPAALEARRNELRQELATLGDLRLGPLPGRHQKCGKPTAPAPTTRAWPLPPARSRRQPRQQDHPLHSCPRPRPHPRSRSPSTTASVTSPVNSSKSAKPCVRHSWPLPPGLRKTRKKTCSEHLAVEVCAEIDRLLDSGSMAKLDFEVVETAACNRALAPAASVLERALNTDKSVAPSLRLACSTCANRPLRQAQSQDPPHSVRPLTLRCTYYNCQARGQDFVRGIGPWGLAGVCHSPGLARLLDRPTAHLSFADTRTMM